AATLTVTSSPGYDVGSPSAATGTITDDETGVINFEADKSVGEGAGSTTLKATLTITGSGTGTTGLDQTLTVSATSAGGGTATGGGTDYSFSTTTLTFAAATGASIDSSTATVTIVDDKRLEGSETANFSIGSLSSNLNGTTSIGDNTHTLT